MDTDTQQAAAWLRAAKQIVALTGAGASKESGVPTFRDAMDGLWARYDPQELATPGAFQRNPKLVWDWYEFRRGLVAQARPNPGHTALAELERRFPSLAVITQNVDDLHEQAGSRDVVHLHGNIARSKCYAACRGEPTLIDVAALDYDHEAGPPPCPHCGAWVRPDVVWFGEMLPATALSRAYDLSADCDVMLVVGTSGLVTPAANLPIVARQAGAQVIEINPDETPISHIAQLRLHGPSGQVLPQLVEALDA